MRDLSDHILKKTYIQAQKLELRPDFIELLNQEILRRKQNCYDRTSLNWKDDPSLEPQKNDVQRVGPPDVL
ncbi:sporulation histidine kinase inhibitor Sda [Halobacillus sp. GSS1]|nr:sporulation histidine kinase inhibitor Sda [Halobacillus sp. GSS1]